MPTRTNSLNTRIQLKIDTEANWNQAVNFRPLRGELIIYSADDARPFSRLKVGDGTHTVSALPFIDAGTVNGRVLEDMIQVYGTRAAFPLRGEEDNLYVNLTDKQIYCWTSAGGFTRIGGLTYSSTSTSINAIDSWDPGSASNARMDQHILKITNGAAPTLQMHEETVVTAVNVNPIDEEVNNS